MEDGKLLGRLANGDRDAFWELWARYEPVLRRECLRRFRGRPEEAEDALQETMLKAWDRLPVYAPQIRNLKAYLSQLVCHVCTDTYRRAKREQPLDIEADLTPPAPPFTDHESRITDHELRLIDRLPPRLREPFILYAFHEMSYHEIAAQFGISDHNARQCIYEARKILRKGWQCDGVESEEACEERVIQEIRSKIAQTRTVLIKLPSGAAISYHLILDQKLPRRAIRIQILREYVQRYPRGYKKRLELAHLLYANGEWGEAIEQYRQVL